MDSTADQNPKHTRQRGQWPTGEEGSRRAGPPQTSLRSTSAATGVTVQAPGEPLALRGCTVSNPLLSMATLSSRLISAGSSAATSGAAGGVSPDGTETP